MELNLKPKQYYIDLYDHGTVDICRRFDKSSADYDPMELKKNKISKRQTLLIDKGARQWLVHVQSGERHLNKEKTIREWMDADQKRDELYESAQPPEDIPCLTCRNRLKVACKELWTEHEKEDRVLFMYDCPNKCLPHRAFFSDGEEWRTKQPACLRCGSLLIQESEDDGLKLITTSSCKKCSHAEKEEYVWSAKKGEDIDENFAADRDRYCMTDEEGKKYQDEKWNIERIGKFMKE